MRSCKDIHALRSITPSSASLLTDGRQDTTLVDHRSTRAGRVAGMAEGPAYTRLGVDERRRRLLELGTDLFARFSYDELSMARIAREAGISKALMYHYFPSKQAYFAAALEEKAGELATLTETDPSLPPLEQLTASLDAFLGWVEDNREAYGKLVRSAAAIPEVREIVDRVRDMTSARILDGISPGGDARAAAAGRGARVAVVHGRRDPRLGRAARPHARPAAGAAARDAARRGDRGRREPRPRSAAPELLDAEQVDHEHQRLVRGRSPAASPACRRRARAGSRAAGGRRPSCPRRPGPSPG